MTTIASLWNAQLCRKRIQGITGDTLGANVEVCEALILAAGAIFNSSRLPMLDYRSLPMEYSLRLILIRHGEPQPEAKGNFEEYPVVRLMNG